MGLKATLKEQMPEALPSRPEDLQLIKDLTAKLENAQQTIQTLQSKSSMHQSEMQKMQSAVTNAQKEIESLKSRAASVNETELKNQKLLKEATQAENLSVRALQEAQQERARAERANNEAKKEREAAQAEARNRREAEDKARHAEYVASNTKDVFKTLFIANAIFTAALAFFQLYDHRNILAECGKWFVARGKGIAGFFGGVKSLYIGMEHGMASWKWPVPLCFILTTLVFLLIVAVIIVGVYFLVFFLSQVLHSISSEYDNGLFKAAISVDIAIILFFFCLWFYIPIKAVMRINIFSIWLIFAAVGVLIWNAPEIIRGVKNG